MPTQSASPHPILPLDSFLSGEAHHPSCCQVRRRLTGPARQPQARRLRSMHLPLGAFAGCHLWEKLDALEKMLHICESTCTLSIRVVNEGAAHVFATSIFCGMRICPALYTLALDCPGIIWPTATPSALPTWIRATNLTSELSTRRTLP